MKIQVVSCVDLAVAMEFNTSLRYRVYILADAFQILPLGSSRHIGSTYQDSTKRLVFLHISVENGRGGVDKEVVVNNFGLWE